MAKYDLDTIRHSTAHLMAQAVERVFSKDKIQLGIGPVIEHGFYYDIDLEERITDEHLQEIEKEMFKIVDEDLPITRHEVSRPDAISMFEKMGQTLKVELINDFSDGEATSYYTQGEFTDLCRGPHVERTGHLPKFFKLTSTAGAYWRGDSSRPMLQRIYAVCFQSKKELKQHLHYLEEAKKRDHRKLGKELDLFIFDKVAPAMPFFMPKGAFIYNKLVDFMRRIYTYYGYSEVITPQILDSELWHTSGHYENYKENMYFTPIDDREFAVKPMNCPCHMLMFRSHKYSYRDLPLRFADFGRLHRYEKSGTLAGLTRVRTFCQDDAHVFLPTDLIQAEIAQLLEMFEICYTHFGFTNIRTKLSTRPEKKVGSDEIWDSAETALKQALESSKIEYELNEGDGAFYGPKIDVQISDAIGRYHQLGTIQLDFNLPERFNLNFTNQKGEMERPVVIHRALLGSLERFLGVFIEHTGGAFPFWLAPTQLTIVPINNEAHLDYCTTLARDLRELGIRVEIDDRNESMGLKTRTIQKAKIPFMAVVGDREMEESSVNLRKYGEKASQSLTCEQLKKDLIELKEQEIPERIRSK